MESAGLNDLERLKQYLMSTKLVGAAVPDGGGGGGAVVPCAPACQLANG